MGIEAHPHNKALKVLWGIFIGLLGVFATMGPFFLSLLGACCKGGGSCS